MNSQSQSFLNQADNDATFDSVLESYIYLLQIDQAKRIQNILQNDKKLGEEMKNFEKELLARKRAKRNKV